MLVTVIVFGSNESSVLLPAIIWNLGFLRFVKEEPLLMYYLSNNSGRGL